MQPNQASEKAIIHPPAAFASLPEEAPTAAWEQIEDGRYMPRRVRGSCHGRELG